MLELVRAPSFRHRWLLLALAGLLIPSLSVPAAPSPDVPDLLEALRTGTGSEREAAALEAAETAPPEALPHLIRALREDASSAVREASAFALGAYTPPTAETVAALMDALHGRDPRLKTVVATTLGRLGKESEQVIQALVESLGSEDARSRQSALIVLERIGPPIASLPGDEAGVVPAVAERLRTDPDERVRRFAVSVLAAVGEGAGDGAVSALLEAARSDASERVRQYSVEALPFAEAPASQAVPVLTEALSDEDWGVRVAAAKALGSYGPEAVSALPALEKVQKDDEKPVREAATAALEAIRGATEDI